MARSIPQAAQVRVRMPATAAAGSMPAQQLIRECEQDRHCGGDGHYRYLPPGMVAVQSRGRDERGRGESERGSVIRGNAERRGGTAKVRNGQRDLPCSGPVSGRHAPHPAARQRKYNSCNFTSLRSSKYLAPCCAAMAAAARPVPARSGTWLSRPMVVATDPTPKLRLTLLPRELCAVRTFCSISLSPGIIRSRSISRAISHASAPLAFKRACAACRSVSRNRSKLSYWLSY